jgi:hypothetical protein
MAGSVLASQLPEVDAVDGLVLAERVATLTIAAFTASWFPARRAAGIPLQPLSQV